MDKLPGVTGTPGREHRRGDAVLEQPPRHCARPSLINVALLEHGRGSTEIGIGSNLLSSEWVLVSRTAVLVERSGSARERYEHSLRTAATSIM